MAHRSLPVTAIPLLLLAGAAAFVFYNQDAADAPSPGETVPGNPAAIEKATPGAPGSATASSPAGPGTSSTANAAAAADAARAAGSDGWIPLDLKNAPALDRLPGWEVRRGNFQLIRDPDNTRPMLELLPEPIVEGKIRCARMLWGGGGVRARMQGEKSRRAHPRFSVGLHQDRELHLRAFPGENRLELVACDPDLLNESLLTKAAVPDWNPASTDWIWLELQIIPAPAAPAASNMPPPPLPDNNPAAPNDTAAPPPPAGASPMICEGRVWIGNTPRPENPQLVHPLQLPPAVFFAAIQGAPFALKPIRIDAAAVLPLARPAAGGAGIPAK